MSRGPRRATRKVREVADATLDQCDSFRPAPALALPFVPKGILDPPELSCPHQTDWASAAQPRVRRTKAQVVLADSALEVRGAADVERSVCTFRRCRSRAWSGHARHCRLGHTPL